VREEGRQSFIKALVWSLAGAALYGLAVGLLALYSAVTAPPSSSDNDGVNGGSGLQLRPGEVRNRNSVQPIPNVPRDNY
jgi:hypothetical protein